MRTLLPLDISYREEFNENLMNNQVQEHKNVLYMWTMSRRDAAMDCSWTLAVGQTWKEEGEDIGWVSHGTDDMQSRPHKIRKRQIFMDAEESSFDLMETQTQLRVSLKTQEYLSGNGVSEQGYQYLKRVFLL
ncbi:hypothetical protein BTVI_122121 [Pitangus sulphuratus]|nr:hypothetical protein BTVI_122121 [Pitangus sulphuratus]